MGTFGDSLTTSPSYTELLAAHLGYRYLEQATGGISAATLDSQLPSTTSTTVTTSMLLIGINDVLAGTSAATIEASLTSIMSKLPNPRICTILPFGNYTGWTSGKEAVRQEVNTWIKATFSHVTDAELVMGDGDPDQPVIKAEYDSGDGLHINHDAGDVALAQAMYDQSFHGT